MQGPTENRQGEWVPWINIIIIIIIKGKGTSFTTGLKQEDRNKQSVPCPLCERPHNLNDCEQFLKKTLTERREFVVKKKLCFGCFSAQHIAKNCKERQACKTCKKQHPTTLHDNDWVKKTSSDSDTQPGAEPRVRSNRTAICNITEAGYVLVNMGILPVYLFHKSDPAEMIKVYALLDNASGGTFVSEKSMKALGIEGSDTDLILTTIHGTHSATKKAIEGLVVTSIKEEDVMLDLLRTFTRHEIPTDRNVIAELQRAKRASEAPWVRKIGNPSSRENLVMTSAYERANVRTSVRPSRLWGRGRGVLRSSSRSPIRETKECHLSLAVFCRKVRKTLISICHVNKG